MATSSDRPGEVQFDGNAKVCGSVAQPLDLCATEVPGPSMSDAIRNQLNELSVWLHRNQRGAPAPDNPLHEP